jgi:hypothetical protein
MVCSRAVGPASLPVDHSSFAGRLFRRFGRFAIAIGSLIAFFAGGLVAYGVTALAFGVWWPKLCLAAAFGCAFAFYTLFDRLGLIPDDPDKIITLSLTERASDAAKEPWVSGDFDKR